MTQIVAETLDPRDMTTAELRAFAQRTQAALRSDKRLAAELHADSLEQNRMDDLDARWEARHDVFRDEDEF